MKSFSTERSPQVIPLWPDGAPGSENWEQQEQEVIILFKRRSRLRYAEAGPAVRYLD